MFSNDLVVFINLQDYTRIYNKIENKIKKNNEPLHIYTIVILSVTILLLPPPISS